MFIEHWKLSVLEENNVVLNENSVEGKPCIIEKVRPLSSKFSYTDLMMNMKLPAVVIPLSIYHGWSNRTTFWEEKFSVEEKLFSAVNMKMCGHRNVSKHREIRGSDKYVALDISLEFDSLEKMKITSSYPKENSSNHQRLKIAYVPLDPVADYIHTLN